MPNRNNNKSSKVYRRKSQRVRAPNVRNTFSSDSIIPSRVSALLINPERLFLDNHGRVTLPYRETISFGASTSPQVYVFRANGPYDPNQTGTGSQPVGWDNFLTFYEASYTVGSQLKVTYFNTGTGAPVQIAITPTSQSTSVTSYDTARMMPRTRHAICDGSTKGGKSYATVGHSMSVLQFFGGNFDRDYLAIGQAVPGKQFYWSISFQSADQTTTLTGIVTGKIGRAHV